MEKGFDEIQKWMHGLLFNRTELFEHDICLPSGPFPKHTKIRVKRLKKKKAGLGRWGEPTRTKRMETGLILTQVWKLES